jgi:hypothetical protein
MKHQRILLGILLFSILLGVMLYDTLNHNTYDPDSSYIITHADQFRDTNVTISGTVQSIDAVNHSFSIQITGSPHNILHVTTTNLPQTIHPGDTVELYGTLTNRTQMTSIQLLIYEQEPYNLIFLRSLPAIPFVLYLFFKTYRFNRKRVCFERRQRHG